MVLISLISAVASVQTEWVMNHSQYRHESLNLQNMRLYSIGMALNAAYYWQSGGRLDGFLSDMRAPHWAVVLVLALMGLITVSSSNRAYARQQDIRHSKGPCQQLAAVDLLCGNATDDCSGTGSAYAAARQHAPVCCLLLLLCGSCLLAASPLPFHISRTPTHTCCRECS